jgi:hypothetical protein
MSVLRIIALLVLFSLLAGGAVVNWRRSQPHPEEEIPASINLRAEPQQVAIPDPLPIPFHTPRADVSLWPRATYRIDGHIVSADRYRLDIGSTLAPRDLSLAWGRVPEHLSALDFSHGHRFFTFRYNNRAPFDIHYVEQHAANMHLIPATDNLRKLLLSVREGQTIRLQGFLVDVTGKVRNRQFVWKTSTTRDDKGDGACEVMYVREVVYRDKVYR